MFSNVIDYAISDAYPLMLLGAAEKIDPGLLIAKKGFDLKAHHRDFPTDAMGLVPDTADIPDLISGQGVAGRAPFNTKSGPSFKADRLALHWRDQGRSHRDDGPAEVLMVGVKKWHRNGLLHRDPAPKRTEGFQNPRPALEVEIMKVNWLREDRFARDAGPHEIVIKGLQVFAQDGQETERVQSIINFEFAKINGTRITQTEIEAFMEKNPEIEINMLDPVYFFTNPMDEFIFLQDIGQAI